MYVCVRLLPNLLTDVGSSTASVAPSRADTMPTATSIPHMPVSYERAPSMGASSVAGSMVTIASRRLDVYESGHRSRGGR